MINKRWIKRFGAAGFLFFFIKGMAWLALAGAAGLGLMKM
jgi:hypothetical protein